MSVSKLRLPAMPALLGLGLAAAVLVSFAADQAYSAEATPAKMTDAERRSVPPLTTSLTEPVAAQTIVIRVGAMNLKALSLETFGDLEETSR